MDRRFETGGGADSLFIIIFFGLIGVIFLHAALYVFTLNLLKVEVNKMILKILLRSRHLEKIVTPRIF